MKKRKAVFEVEFDLDFMIDKDTLQKEFGGSELEMLKWLYKHEGIGIFDVDLKLVEVKKK